MRHSLPALLLALTAACMVTAAQADWTSRAPDSTLEFTASFEGASAPGVFRRFDVTLAPGVDGPAGGQLQVQVDITSADFSSPDLNEAVADPEWFDFAAHPAAVFTSQRISVLGDGQYRAEGRLRLKGFERNVTFDFDWRPGGQEASMRGQLDLLRGDFGIGSGDWADDDAIGQRVEVRFDVILEAVD